ncbi:hypothetical protein D3C74_194510 [compost metagenome]
MEYPLEDKILHDIAEHIKTVMISSKIKFDQNNDDKKVILAYMNIVGKRVPARKRDVIISNELYKKIIHKSFPEIGQDIPQQEVEKIIDLIGHFQSLFQNGEDINNHLSKEIFSSKRQDILLNTWNIKHIHLNMREANSKTAMKTNRSEFLLFCIVENETVYFFDVLRHPKSNEFSSYSFLQIAYNNRWMEKLGFMEMDNGYVPYSLEPKITDDEMLYCLYSNQINVSFDFLGHGFISVASGVTSSGDARSNAYLLQKLIRTVINLSTQMDGYCGYTPISSERASGAIEYKSNGTVMKHDLIFD